MWTEEKASVSAVRTFVSEVSIAFLNVCVFDGNDKRFRSLLNTKDGNALNSVQVGSKLHECFLWVDVNSLPDPLFFVCKLNL